MGSKSREEQIAWLYQIIIRELQKPENEADEDLISECSVSLDELQSDEDVLSPEEIRKRLNAIYERVEKDRSDIVLTANGKTKKPFPAKRPRKLLLKVFAIAAAFSLVLILAVSIMAYSNGYGSVWKFVNENSKLIAALHQGTKTEKNNITVTKNSEKQVYGSVFDFLEAEEMQILYPKDSEELLQPVSVVSFEKEDGKRTVSISFQKENFEIIIRNYSDLSPSDLSGCERVSVGSVDYYIFADLKETYCQHNGNSYTIKCDDLDLLKSIIQTMKEYPQ